MSTIVKRADGRFQTSIQQDGLRQFIYGRTEAEVKRKLAEAQRGATLTGGLPAAGKRTVLDLLEAFLGAASPTLKPRTVYNYRQIVRLYINPTLGGVPLNKLAPEHLQNLYTRLRRAGKTRAPQHAHMVLHRALRFAVLWRWLPENPADRVIRPGYHPPRKELWSPEEARAFFEAARSEYYWPVWRFLALTGCRISECLGLRWEEIKLEEGRVEIRRNLQRIGGEWVLSTPKTRSGERTILLPPEGVALLRAQRDAQDRWREAEGAEWNKLGLLFTTRSGKPIDARNCQHRLQAVCREKGIPPFTLHQLRHLHATFLLANRVPVPVVSARLGHSNPSITMSVYAHAVRSQDALAASAIEAALR